MSGFSSQQTPPLSSLSSSWPSPRLVQVSSPTFDPSLILVSPPRSFGSTSTLTSANDELIFGGHGSAFVSVSAGAHPAGNGNVNFKDLGSVLAAGSSPGNSYVNFNSHGSVSVSARASPGYVNVNGHSQEQDDPFEIEMDLIPQGQGHENMNFGSKLLCPSPIPMMSSTMSFAPGPPQTSTSNSTFEEDRIRLERYLDALSDTKPDEESRHFFKAIGSPPEGQSPSRRQDSSPDSSDSEYGYVPLKIRKLLTVAEENQFMNEAATAGIGNGQIDNNKKYYDRQFILYWGLKKLGLNPARPYVCPVPGCDKEYKNENGLKYHASYGAHAPTQKFQCCSCEKSYRCRSGLLSHRKKVHDQKPVVKRVKPKPKLLNVQDYIKSFNESQAKKKREIEIVQQADGNEDNTIKLYYYNHFNCNEKEEEMTEVEPIDIDLPMSMSNTICSPYKGDEFTIELRDVEVIDTNANANGEDKTKIEN